MTCSHTSRHSRPSSLPRCARGSRRAGRCLVAALIGVLAMTGCRGLGWPDSLSWPGWLSRSQSPAADGADSSESSPARDSVGDYISINGLGMITLEGVGLVTGLDGTGGDPRPSQFRMSLLKDMQRRDVPDPKALLRSTRTALVIVRAYLPPLIRKGESFDVEVRLPPGSEATSLNGGWLMETDLAERAVVSGARILAGHVFARAKGHILISHGEGDSGELAGVLRRGRVPGGGLSRKDRDLVVSLRNRYRSVRMARRIADRIGTRFYAYNRHGIREPLASPKTDRTIVLKIHPKYKDNFPRFLRVIRLIAIREDNVARQVRMQQLAGELESVQTARQAALSLEAIGTKSIPFLKTALDHPESQVRFHAACALAYLDDNSGAATLAEAARHQRAFRVYALAALSTLEDAPSQLLLRGLLKPLAICNTDGCPQRGKTVEGPCPHCQAQGQLKQSNELQYGAFRALWTRDRLDPTIRGELVGDLFTLHEIEAGGRPLIHLTQLQRAEIVLFGRDQRLRTPLAVQAGNHIWINAQPGATTVTISRYQVGRPPNRQVVSTRVADVIRASVKLGASYPDIVQMLVQAQRQQNVPGQIAIDAVPRTGRVLIPNGDSQAGPTPARATAPTAPTSPADLAPNLFPVARRGPESAFADDDESQEPGPGSTDQDDLSSDGEPSPGASLVDRRRDTTDTTASQATDPQARSQDSSGSRFSFLEKLFR